MKTHRLLENIVIFNLILKYIYNSQLKNDRDQKVAF